MATFIIANTDKHLYTLNPNGSEYKELTGGNFVKNRIGEYKKITMTFESAVSIASKKIFFNPGLFLNPSALSPFLPGNIPTEGYSYQVDGGATPGTYTMFLNVAVPYIQGVIQNYICEVTITSSTVFTITLKYFQLYDLKSYINSSLENNASKLLKDFSADPNNLVVSGSNIYNTSGLCPVSYIIVYDTTDPTTYGSVYVDFAGYQAGFYSANELNAAPFFNTPVFTIYDTLSAIKTELSIAYDSKISFKINTGGSNVDNVFFMLIRTDTNDNTTDFFSNYEASFAKIITSGSGTIDNKIKAPSQIATLVSGATYESYFRVDKTLLNVGEKYRVIAICYLEEYGSYNVNSFISDEITVGVPAFDGNGYSFEGRLSDYINEYLGNELTCTIEERMKSSIIFDYSYTAFKNDIFNRLGIVLTDNDCRRYLTQIKCEIYEESGSTIQYLKRDIATKIDPVTYSTPSDITLDFTGDILTIDYFWRNRYEDGQVNIETVVSGVTLGTPTSNQYWGGRNLKIKTSLSFFYDDYVAPFTDIIEYIQLITVKDYEYTDLFIQTEAETEIPAFYCTPDNPCLEAVLGLASPSSYKLITTVEPSPGSIGSIEENEEFAGILTQLTTGKIASQETNYSDTEATKGKFCLETSTFLLSLPYKISALAKKTSGTAPFARITEDDIIRDVEDGSTFREIE